MNTLDYDDYNANSPDAERVFRSLPKSYSGTYRIADGITSINKDAFKECTKLTSIDIPATVKIIGDNAFEGCIQLRSIDIPSSVESIGKEAFKRCFKLTSVNIQQNSSLKSIGDYAFDKCSELLPFVFSESVSQGSNIFEGCKTDIPNNKEIVVQHTSSEDKGSSSLIRGRCVIQNDTLIIPEGTTKIGRYDLTNEVFKNVRIPASVKSIEQCAFRNCKNLTSVIVPKGITKIDDYTFEGCKELTSIVIPSSVTSIGEGAFLGCKKLSNIEIPSSVTSIGEVAFLECEKLPYIIIPSNVIKIGKNAFSYCSELSIAVIHGNYISINWPLFVDCKKLNIIKPEHKIGNYVIDNGIVYDKDKTELYEFLPCLCHDVDIVINKNVRTIHTNAFSNMEQIRTLRLPPHLKKIEKSAFNLTSAKTTIYAQTVLSDNIELKGDEFVGIGNGETKHCTLKVPVEFGYDYRRDPKWSSKFIIETISAEDIATK